MYKFLLSWRYLRSRYIALASVISVTLGVATLIIVNAVMAGFTEEMHNRLHGIFSDIVFESHNINGFPDAEAHMAEIKHILGDDLEGSTATVSVPAMLNMKVRGQWVSKHVNMIGIDDATYAEVSDFGQYLLHEENRRNISFMLREGNYDPRMDSSGWEYRRKKEEARRYYEEQMRKIRQTPKPMATAGTDSESEGEVAVTPPLVPSDPIGKHGLANEEENTFDAMTEQNTGIILGITVASMRYRDREGEVQDFFMARPGDDVQLTFPTAATPPKAVSTSFTVVDLYESKMSEYDSSLAFVPLSQLQKLRGMIDPLTQVASVSAIQLKLREGADLNAARDKLRARFPATEYAYQIQTWRDMQGPLLAAVRMETTILNILLFLIIAVAGFGILATFFMIVVEKTKDIGILKSLGAPSHGVMSIFLNYGLSLGVAGSGVGLVLGLLFVVYINKIAEVLEWITGREVFDPTVYYFDRIPTIIDPVTIVFVMIGSVLIAVSASVLPAMRAARLHPVEALRYE